MIRRLLIRAGFEDPHHPGWVDLLSMGLLIAIAALAGLSALGDMP